MQGFYLGFRGDLQLAVEDIGLGVGDQDEYMAFAYGQVVHDYPICFEFECLVYLDWFELPQLCEGEPLPEVILAELLDNQGVLGILTEPDEEFVESSHDHNEPHLPAPGLLQYIRHKIPEIIDEGLEQSSLEVQARDS